MACKCRLNTICFLGIWYFARVITRPLKIRMNTSFRLIQISWEFQEKRKKACDINSDINSDMKIDINSAEIHVNLADFY